MVSGSKTKTPGKPKQKMAFAKNKNEAILAIAVFGIFILYTLFNIGNYFYQQHVQSVQATNAEKMMASDQQKNLQSLDGEGGPSMEDPTVAPGQVPPAGNSAIQQDANDIYNKTLSAQGGAPSSPAQMPPNVAQNPSMNTGGGDIEIMARSSGSRIRRGKMVTIAVAESGRSNPFLPAAENVVPSSLPRLNLTAPPESAMTDSDADKVMGTTISGILYDKYSPSAILNIGGTDYLVKRGDTINRYRVLSITKDQVMVQLGRNVYKAGVGQILAQGQVNINPVSNLNRKFGGNAVSVSVKKHKNVKNDHVKKRK